MTSTLATWKDRDQAIREALGLPREQKQDLDSLVTSELQSRIVANLTEISVRDRIIRNQAQEIHALTDHTNSLQEELDEVRNQHPNALRSAALDGATSSGFSQPDELLSTNRLWIQKIKPYVPKPVRMVGNYSLEGLRRIIRKVRR
ncbi:hypothetical protein ACU19_06555 [Actinobaculum suis]|nr:hypothetical protein ACU19_06555 [Actinobaculum suis]